MRLNFVQFARKYIVEKSRIIAWRCKVSDRLMKIENVWIFLSKSFFNKRVVKIARENNYCFPLGGDANADVVNKKTKNKQIINREKVMSVIVRF